MSSYHRESWDGFSLNGVIVLEKIGEKTFTTYAQKRKYKYDYVTDILKVKCTCGTEYEVLAKSWLNNKSKCRGCWCRKISIGETFGELLVLDWYSKPNKSGRKQIWYKCQCSCGKIIETKSDTIKGGEVNNCSSCSNSKLIKHRRMSLERYYSKCKTGAKRRSRILEFTITLDDIRILLENQKRRCKLSNIPISFEDGTASLDRIDSSRGYTPDNIQWVYRSINYMKNELSQDDFISFCISVAKHSEVTSCLDAVSLPP